MSKAMEKKKEKKRQPKSKILRWKTMSVVDYESPELHKKLAKILRHIVSQGTKQIKQSVQVPNRENSETTPVAVATSSHKLEDDLASTSAAPACKRKGSPPMTSSVVVGDFPLSFGFPEYITDNIDMDQIATRDHKNNFVINEEKRSSLRFSFRERLQNWHLQCRQRPNRRIDVFYRHPSSRRIFRSIREVIKFLMYEICPRPTKVVDNNDKATLKRKKMATEEASSEGKQKITEFSSFKAKKPYIKTKAKKKNNNNSGGLAEIVIDISEEEEEEEHEKVKRRRCSYSELLNISEDWTAYEPELYDYFS